MNLMYINESMCIVFHDSSIRGSERTGEGEGEGEGVGDGEEGEEEEKGEGRAGRERWKERGKN